MIINSPVNSTLSQWHANIQNRRALCVKTMCAFCAPKRSSAVRAAGGLCARPVPPADHRARTARKCAVLRALSASMRTSRVSARRVRRSVRSAWRSPPFSFSAPAAKRRCARRERHASRVAPLSRHYCLRPRQCTRQTARSCTHHSAANAQTKWHIATVCVASPSGKSALETPTPRVASVVSPRFSARHTGETTSAMAVCDARS